MGSKIKMNVRKLDRSKLSPPHAFAAFSWPESWPKLGTSDDLDLEIGCGVGLHPIRYASNNPTRQLIALEHTREKFERFENRLQSHASLTSERGGNLLAIHGDAIRWACALFPANCISRCFLLYPNPEPKSPSKRWLRSPFMHALREMLRNSGEIHLATDQEWYFNEALDFAQNFWAFKLISARRFQQSDQPEARTHFEKKYLARGAVCFDAVFAKQN